MPGARSTVPLLARLTVILTAALVTAVLVPGCGPTNPPCGATECSLRLAVGERHPVADGTDVVVWRLADGRALVTLGAETQAVTVGTTVAVAGYRVTVAALSGESAHVLVAPGSAADDDVRGR